MKKLMGQQDRALDWPNVRRKAIEHCVVTNERTTALFGSMKAAIGAK